MRSDIAAGEGACALALDAHNSSNATNSPEFIRLIFIMISLHWPQSSWQETAIMTSDLRELLIEPERGDYILACNSEIARASKLAELLSEILG